MNAIRLTRTLLIRHSLRGQAIVLTQNEWQGRKQKEDMERDEFQGEV